MTGYDRLREIVQPNGTFAISVSTAMHALRYGGNTHEMVNVANRLCGLFGLSAEVKDNAMVFYTATTRAKHPACIVVSMNMGQNGSPSSLFELWTHSALIQVFEGDADDSDVAGYGPNPAAWVQTKDRVLLH